MIFHTINFIIFTRGQFRSSGIVIACMCVCVCQSLACPQDNSSPVQARVTKLSPATQGTLVKIPIFGGRLTVTSKVKFNFKLKLDQFRACPNHYSPPIQARISKFRPQMHFSSFKVPINSELD